MKKSRRAFLMSAVSMISPRALLSLAPLGLLFTPREANAQYVQAAVTVISALNTLSSSRDGGGVALRLAAIDLKLDQVLQNQILLAKAVDEVQKSINRLQLQVPGFITAESYRLLWEEAYGIFDQLKKLNQRQVSIGSKVTDYVRLFQKLYDSVTVVRSRIATTYTGAEGVASMLSAAQALILYVDSMKAMAALERALPRSEKWVDNRAQKMKEISETLTGSIDEMREKRIPEAVADQKKIAAETLAKMSPLWKTLWDVLMEAASRSPQLTTHVIDRCFRSTYYPTSAWKHTTLNYVHLDFTLSCTSHIVANKVAALSEVQFIEKPKLASMGLKRHWADNRGNWIGIKDRATYEEFSKHWPNNRGTANAIWYAAHPPSDENCTLYELPLPALAWNPSFGVDPWDAWGDAYFKGAFVDAAYFSSLCDLHAQAMLYQEALRKCQEIGMQLNRECLLFSKSVDDCYAEDTSIWERVRGLFE